MNNSNQTNCKYIIVNTTNVLKSKTNYKTYKSIPNVTSKYYNNNTNILDYKRLTNK